jgi:hypothetical protein
MCVAEKKTINAARFFRGEFAVIEVIATIYPFQIRKQAELKKIEYTVALARLHEFIKILVGETEAHAEVEKNASSLILQKDFVATDFVDSSVKREGGHNNVSCSQGGEKRFELTFWILNSMPLIEAESAR